MPSNITTGCATADGLPHGQAWILLSTILVLGMSPGKLSDAISSAFLRPFLLLLMHVFVKFN
jgi:hypothetical protein